MMSLAVTTESMPTPSNIFGVKDFDKFTQKKVTVVSGAGALKAGTLLGKITTGGKYTTWDNRTSGGATDGSEVLVGVLVHDVDATSADQPAVIYVDGTFLQSALTAVTTVTVDTKNTLGTINIIAEVA